MHFLCKIISKFCFAIVAVMILFIVGRFMNIANNFIDADRCRVHLRAWSDYSGADWGWSFRDVDEWLHEMWLFWVILRYLAHWVSFDLHPNVDYNESYKILIEFSIKLRWKDHSLSSNPSSKDPNLHLPRTCSGIQTG